MAALGQTNTYERGGFGDEKMQVQKTKKSPGVNRAHRNPDAGALDSMKSLPRITERVKGVAA